jgi:recombination protein RecT
MAQVPAKQETKTELAERWAKDAKVAFLSVINDEKVWNRECMFAIQALRKSEKLVACNPISIRTAVANVALTGITLNPALQMAFLIPRDGECCLDFSYRGLIKILTDSGSVRAIDAHVVFDFDDFNYELGSEPFVHYKPSMTMPEGWVPTAKQIWEHLLCSVTIATLHDGSKSICVMPAWKIRRTAKTSKAWGNVKMPWETFADEQIRKVAIKYHYKTLPQTERASEAVRVLNEHEGLDLEPKGDRAQDLANRVSEMANTASKEQPGGDTASGGRETQGQGTGEGKAPVCVCTEMEQEWQKAWDCPKHGRMASQGS